MDKIYNLVVLGNTGVGKSALLNMLSGSTDSFKVGENVFSETQYSEAKTFNLYGKKDQIKIRLCDTQGLSDSGGDLKDMEHIKQMVESLKKLEKIDLFLICLDGTNPRFTPYTRSTINLFEDIFGEDFLNHCVLVFNKWTTPDESKKINLKRQYQEIIKNDFRKDNIPCYFVDSFCNLVMMRDNIFDGTQSMCALHPNIQERTFSELYGLLNFMYSKNNSLDVTGIKPKETDRVKLQNLANIANQKAKEAEEKQKEYEKQYKEFKDKQADLEKKLKDNEIKTDEYQKQINQLKSDLEKKGNNRPGFNLLDLIPFATEIVKLFK